MILYASARRLMRTEGVSLKRFVACAGALLLTAVAAPAIASSFNEATIAIDARPSWVAGAPLIGLTTPTSRIDFAVVLTYRNAPALAAFNAAVSDPTSALYHHFLSEAEFRRRYSPSPQSVSSVSRWLSKTGITVDGATASAVAIRAHATAALVEKALGTTLAEVSEFGSPVRVSLTSVKIPSRFRSVIAGISGLDTERAHPGGQVPPTFYYNQEPNCSQYFQQRHAPSVAPTYKGKKLFADGCGYIPSQLRAGYGLDKISQTGRGVTIAIVDAYASKTVEQDLNSFSKKNHLPVLRPGQFTQSTLEPVVQEIPEVDPPVSNPLVGPRLIAPDGWSAEEALDTDAVHTTAPDADIYYEAGLSDQLEQLYLADLDVIEGARAQVISNSWTEIGEAIVPGAKVLFEEMASQANATGVTLLFCTGDHGDDISWVGHRTANYPATSPAVTAVGGTALYMGKSGEYLGEGAFGDDYYAAKGGTYEKTAEFAFAGGGGVSTVYPEPAYQVPVVPKSLATFGGVKPGRVIPDIALDGDCSTTQLVGQTGIDPDGVARYHESGNCGTSVATPLLAGILADAIQANGTLLGDINPTIYAAKARSTLRDIVPTSLPTALATIFYSDVHDPHSPLKADLEKVNTVGTLHILKGFDDSTGLGSPYAPTFIKLFNK